MKIDVNLDTKNPHAKLGNDRSFVSVDKEGVKGELKNEDIVLNIDVSWGDVKKAYAELDRVI